MSQSAYGRSHILYEEDQARQTGQDLTPAAGLDASEGDN
jgi:hypothetical protein